MPRVGCQQERKRRKRKQEGVGVASACLTAPGPLPCVTPGRTSLGALSLSFEGWTGCREVSASSCICLVEVRVTLLGHKLVLGAPMPSEIVVFQASEGTGSG